jgi:hypothetical protein
MPRDTRAIWRPQLPLRPRALRTRGVHTADKPLECHQGRLSRQFLPFPFHATSKIARRAGGTFAWRPRFLPAGGKTLGLSESDDRPRLASPKRTRTAPKARHASAVSRNAGPYADPSHGTYPEERPGLYFMQIPQTPQTMQLTPNSKQSHCSRAAILGFVRLVTSPSRSELPAGRP